MHELIPPDMHTAPRHTHERVGPDYADLRIGDVIEHRPGRTITEADCIIGSLVFMNPHPIHIDAEYAGATGFGRLLVNSSITMGIVSGMTVRSTSGRATANLGWDRVRLRAPVFVGDTLYARSEIVHKRLSASRTDSGIVTISVTARNQHDEVVMTYERSFLMPVAAAPSDSY